MESNLLIESMQALIPPGLADTRRKDIQVRIHIVVFQALTTEVVQMLRSAADRPRAAASPWTRRLLVLLLLAGHLPGDCLARSYTHESPGDCCNVDSYYLRLLQN